MRSEWLRIEPRISPSWAKLWAYFSRKLGKVSDFENLEEVLKGGKIKKKKGKGKKGGGGDSDEDLPSKAEIKKYKAMKEGKRNKDSDSDYR